MRFRGAVLLLVGLLAGALLLAAAPASLADPARAGASREVNEVTARLVPPVVTQGEPALLVGRVKPADGGVDVLIQRQDEGGTWTTYDVVPTDTRGAYDKRLPTGTPSETAYRVLAGGEQSRAVTLKVTANTACGAVPGPVDPDASGEAHCLLQRLDRWRRAGLMGVGQQLNVSNRDYLGPIEALRGEPVSLVGFDLEELAKGETYHFPVPPLHGLLDLAADGAVLSATWHAKNPFAGKVRLKQLLDEDTAAGRRFWDDYDDKLALLERFSHGDEGRYPWTPVVFRPFHEVNGNWFWWGRPDPRVFKKLWNRLQQRAWDAGVHNIVWAFSANRVTSAARDPRPLVPARVDLGGLDTYDPEKGRANAKDRLWLEGWSRVAPEVDRMALTEVGPHGSADGAWNPAVVTRTVREKKLKPLWAMFWFDDGNGRDGVTGEKQISSLAGGLTWLRSCPNGLCSIS